MDLLNISSIHFSVSYGELERNKQELFTLIEQEAEQGANIIVAPEMALSGYSFTGRDEIFPLCIREDDHLLNELEGLGAAFGCYICIGAAMCIAPADVLYNSALIIGPHGLITRYDKVNGEIRWACQGEPTQNNVVDTPWGRAGVLICSDSYYELMARSCALKGADLLLIPANWPSSGPTALDPVEIWRARALENGLYVVGCNRTGKDISMDCCSAVSACLTPAGEVLARHCLAHSSVMRVKLPLAGGRLDSSARLAALSGRRPEHYHSIYRNVGSIQDLTTFYELPEPGKLKICCLVPAQNTFAEWKAEYRKQAAGKSILWLLPMIEGEQLEQVALMLQEEEASQWLLCRAREQGWTLLGSNGGRREFLRQAPGSSWMITDVGPGRIGLTDYAAFKHPECALALSKEGCDLIVLSEQNMTRDMRLLCGARTINHIAVAACCREGAGIWMRPEGHGRWLEEHADVGGKCSFVLDTALTRTKRFQDRLDFQTLLTTS